MKAPSQAATGPVNCALSGEGSNAWLDLETQVKEGETSGY